jgi:hypothetical protein
VSDTNWYTPAWLLDLVRKVGTIGLDPCTDEKNPVCAPTFCTPGGTYDVVGLGSVTKANNDDGLWFHWSQAGIGIVFVNPPYSRQDSPHWAAKIAAEAQAGCEIIALLPARVDTGWWHDYIAAHADAACFLRGRPRHSRPGEEAEGAGKFPSVVVYFGDRAKAFRRVFSGAGWLVEGHPTQRASRREAAGPPAQGQIAELHDGLENEP